MFAIFRLRCILYKVNNPLTSEELMALQEHKTLLENLSIAACGFMHEHSQEYDPPQCPDDVQEQHLGCSHTANTIIENSINLLESLGFIDPHTAEQHKSVLKETGRMLLQLDQYATHEYADKGKLSQRTSCGQLETIDIKNRVRLSLIDAIEKGK